MNDHGQIIQGALGAGVGSMAVIMGVHVDGLVLGLAAAIFASIWLVKIDKRSKAAAAVLLSALVAGYGSPIAAEYLAATIPSIANSHDELRLLLAVLLGGISPTLIPLAVRMLHARMGVQP